MKELKIEQKAKAYDEAIEKGKQIQNTPYTAHWDIMKDVIRRCVKYAIKRLFLKEQYVCDVHKDDVLAWLEKQNKESSWKPSKEEMDVLYGLAYITNQYDEHKEEIITRLYQDLKREFFNGSSYENMFPNTEDSVRRRSTIQILEYARSLDTYNQFGKAAIDKNIAWLEKKAEQEEPQVYETRDGEIITYSETDGYKPADKAEPRFKVGDWVVWDNKISCHVDNIYQGRESLMYTITDTNNMTRSYSVKGFDNNANLWTANDAKDGDVLATLDYILIYKKALPKDGGVSYCHYDFGSSTPQFNFNEDNNWYFGKKAKVYPATKEQRKLLFRKMNEAGYEWDAEKKELKKIEQNPAEWSEEDEEYLNFVIAAIKTLQVKCTENEIKHHSNSQAAPYYAKVINWLKSLRPQKHESQSNEHYELEEFAKIVRGNLTGISKTVQALFENKYLKLTGKKMYGGFKD